MTAGETTNYQRIEAAIRYIAEHFKEQPGLDDIARHIYMSPFHFQRLFTEWAGVSPKKFLQYISIEHAKQVLQNRQATLLDAAFETGLSGTGRLHDLFVNIEGMTPGEYKNAGAALTINYSFAETPFGPILVASTAKGICHIAFAEDEAQALGVLQQAFANAQFRQMVDMVQQQALQVFARTDDSPHTIKLHVKGTGFQLKVWEALLKIPQGQLSTYGNIAQQIEQPGASRAVGTAIGSNPVAFIIPCHRVIQSTGAIGGYMWGPLRKTAIIGWEAAQLSATA
jgi:AraC family transcriptional regulator, regulatory protein of adaptative response / methylated-DNA-[protein]-cysteine methyltransferase